MENFKVWLEQRNFDKYKKIVLSYLNLDTNNGLSQPLESLDRNELYKKLSNLGVFTELPEEKRSQITSLLQMPANQTIGDIIRIMAD